MYEVSVVIPNYNGSEYLENCFNALLKQDYPHFETILVDNGSSDNSLEIMAQRFSWVKIISLDDNYGFCRAVNEGIKASEGKYVILLNNDTEVAEGFVGALTSAIKKNSRRFSCSAMMVQYHDRSKIDDAGNNYCALGWAYARGKDKPVERYQQEQKVFSCCAGAAIYRKSVFEEIGYFDEAHFAYLEDLDVGYRARIHGYRNIYVPSAVVYHVGSGTSGSRYNQFKVGYSSRNNVYVIYKNMPFLQILLNLPFLMAGFLIKGIFFFRKGMGKEYVVGICKGIVMCKSLKKIPFQRKNILNYLRIQIELWVNIVKRTVN